MNKTALTMPADDEQVESVLCGVVTDRIADVTALGSVQVHSDRRVPGDGLPRRLEYRVDPAHLTGQFLLEVNRLIPARHCGLYRQSNHMTGAVPDYCARRAQCGDRIRGTIPCDQHPAEWPSRCRWFAREAALC